MSTGVGVAILGSVSARRDGVEVPLGGAKPRTVLAALAVRVGQVLSVAALADAVWGEEPPGKPGQTLQVYISGLRQALGEFAIQTVPPGYRLAIAADGLDLVRFRRAREVGADAMRQGRFDDAATSFRAALGEWTGPALADLRGVAFADEVGHALDEERMSTLTDRIDADLARGRHREVIGELTVLTHEHPLREPLWAQLITALYRAGRQADALDAYRRVRQLLDDELGIDPGPALRGLEADILAQRDLVAPTVAVTPLSPGDRTVQEEVDVVHHGALVDDRGRTVTLGPAGLRIGRQADNDLVVDEVKASRRHAAITHTPDGFVITDLNSTNGTVVDGVRLQSPVLLHDGAQITIAGRRFTCRLDPSSAG
ncbi:MAG: BTAD domain-containing putative transcriptional regulator [Jatrophihabitans sp.]|uniref:BTAD domain-containing putative transcriptional regulator n=1 Tax=Jatrophihabitans sp. TaxID=1932789 RepID=UPI003F80A3DC